MRQLFSFLLILLLASPVYAAKTSKTEEALPAGGFEGPVIGLETETVEKALTLPSNTRVLLKGNLIARLAKEKNIFLFKDTSGQIEVHISPKQFQGQTIRPETDIQITGKIIRTDHQQDTPRIEVRDLQIVK